MNRQLKFYVDELCTVLINDYALYNARGHMNDIRRIENGETNLRGTIEYHRNEIKKYLKCEENYKFKLEIKEGKKYLKIIACTHGRSVHCFIDKVTGDVYKPAGWNAPAKHVRYNLLDAKSRSLCYDRADWAGGYLYMK